jgi:hypothetical protein
VTTRGPDGIGTTRDLADLGNRTPGNGNSRVIPALFDEPAAASRLWCGSQTHNFRRSVRADSERGVDLVTEREAARVGVGFGGVETVSHVGVADPVFQVDEAE